jgi:FkbM family methyltransferase
MDEDLIAKAFDLALLQSASRFDLSTQEGRTASAAALAELFKALVLMVARPQVTLELGAHAAAFSRAVKAEMPQAQVHAVEANPYCHARFQAEAAAAGVGYHHLAVGEEVREAVFKIARRRDGKELSPTRGSNSLRTKPLDVDYEDAAVSMVTVDHFVAGQGLAGRPTAMWIDVEGCAFEVLSGARRTLEDTTLLMVEVEDKPFWTGQKTAPEVNRLLLRSGFIPVARDFEYKGQYNLVFLRPALYEHHRVRRLLELSFAGAPLNPPSD